MGIRSTLELMLASKVRPSAILLDPQVIETHSHSLTVIVLSLFKPGGIWKAVESCTEMGGSSFALFLGSQRSWKRPALDPAAADRFREQCSLLEFDPAHILPHGSYLMNCGSPKEGSSDAAGRPPANPVLCFLSGSP